MSPWRRPTTQFHGLPSDSLPYTLTLPDGRWEGRGTPPARLKATPSAWQMPARFPGRGRASASRSGTPPRPFDPSVSPSTVRTISATSGRVGAARRPRRPGWADAGAEARGDPTTPESFHGADLDAGPAALVRGVQRGVRLQRWSSEPGRRRKRPWLSRGAVSGPVVRTRASQNRQEPANMALSIGESMGGTIGPTSLLRRRQVCS
jgi:hypothetical protein